MSFIQCDYLLKLKNILRQQGVLAVNLSARDPRMLDTALQNIQHVFETVLICNQADVEDDEDRGKDSYINVVVFALREKIEKISAVNLTERLEKAIKGREVHETVIVEMRSSLSFIEVYADKVGQASLKAKKKAKRNRKRGKKK